MAGITLYPHQQEAVDKIHNGSILTGDVGTGKSITALVYYFTKVCQGSLKINGKGLMDEMYMSRDLYIITTAKKIKTREWQSDIFKVGLGPDRDLNWDGVKVTLDSWQNIQKYENVKDAMFFFDEQRLVGSGAWVKAFHKIAKVNQWIILSATPGDIWMDYMPVFVANGFYKNKTDFCRQHVIYKRYSKFPSIDRYVDQGILQKYRKQILVEMPYARHTIRHIENVLVGHDKEMFAKVQKDRWHVYEERPLKDVGEMFRVMRKVVNSDSTRIDKVIELLDKHPKLIIFYNFDYELEALRTLAATTGVQVAEYNGQKHEDTPEGKSWIYLVQYAAGSEGWNCITTDAMIFFSLNYSYKVNHQAKGRTDRLNTPFTDLYYYIFRSASMIDQAIMRSINTKQDFNEKAFLKGA